eukprot:c26101_g1_i1 orf=139-1599(+)
MLLPSPSPALCPAASAPGPPPCLLSPPDLRSSLALCIDRMWPSNSPPVSSSALGEFRFSHSLHGGLGRVLGDARRSLLRSRASAKSCCCGPWENCTRLASACDGVSSIGAGSGAFVSVCSRGISGSIFVVGSRVGVRNLCRTAVGSSEKDADEFGGLPSETGSTCGSQVLAGSKEGGVDVVGALFQQQRQKEQLRIRVLFGLAIGVGVLGAVLVGGWIFTVALSGASLIATEEYFGLVASHGSMAPPPAFITKVCSAICAALPLLTLYFGGRAGVALTTAAFILAIVLLLQRQKPHFSQLSSVIFGLFYCGYLPCFWVKLRCCLAVPGLNTDLIAGWPALLGGRMHWTVGLLATFISFSCVIAADTGAFIGGKFFGKTPLSILSPKKTFEGAGVGLSAAVAVSVLLARLFQWPSSLISAAALGVLIFLASISGDLLESMIKRDVGVKDSGRLIPGHGGVLDRSDSYIFTGALVYFFVKFVLHSYGL